MHALCPILISLHYLAIIMAIADILTILFFYRSVEVKLSIPQ